VKRKEMLFLGIIFPERYSYIKKKREGTETSVTFISPSYLLYISKYKLFAPHPHRSPYYSISLENLTTPFYSLPMTDSGEGA
jgi:hypothetical protein